MVLEREVVHLHRNPAVGEVRRPLRVVPAVEVAAEDALVVWPVQSREPRRVRVTLTSHAATPLRGRIEGRAGRTARAPPPSPSDFTLAAADEPLHLELVLDPPKALKPGRETLQLAAVLDGRPPLRPRRAAGRLPPHPRHPAAGAGAGGDRDRRPAPPASQAGGLRARRLRPRPRAAAPGRRAGRAAGRRAAPGRRPRALRRDRDRQPRLRDRARSSSAPTAGCSTTRATAAC